ncbi:phosphoribosylformylglycinamidine synthase I [Candidatus Peregrinibacteria bacterium]|nr:phosphoribosylformylglycinamidine synthase I [Candidatus Peregrinibacteria bacterium]
MRKPIVAVVSFPGSNGEVESMRIVRKTGMEAMFFRWNDDRGKLKDVDGYFVPGGFSYEDRGRSGMVAARDNLMEFIDSEAESGKVVIGICNGAQILVESGLIPNGDGLRMSLARNAVRTPDRAKEPPFLSEWIWITRSCAKDRCATSWWDGVMKIPIAHGEGRFTTRDAELINELKKNDQIAFSYCNGNGDVSDDPEVTPNGSLHAIAGICNPAGNVIALMPHPERAQGGGDMYFESMRRWMEKRKSGKRGQKRQMAQKEYANVVLRDRVHLPIGSTANVEIFIETLIVNNEERTVEKAARRIIPALALKQWKYLSVEEGAVGNIMSDLTVFNSNKERAFLRRGKLFSQWDHDSKSEAAISSFFAGTVLIRRDIPDAFCSAFMNGAETGTAYGIENISEQELCSNRLLEIFANPHASTLERLILK